VDASAPGASQQRCVGLRGIFERRDRAAAAEADRLAAGFVHR
jgi:hypothetical protein